MASQIEQLRASFEKMNTTQKKAFIDNLKQKLQGSKNAEYIKFLNDCVQKYNAAVRGGSATPIPTSTTSASSPVVAKGKQKKSPLKWIAVCLAVVAGIGVGFYFFIFNSGNSPVTPKNDLAYVWQHRKEHHLYDDSCKIYEFSSDGQFRYFHGVGRSLVGHLLAYGNIYTGSYIIDGNNLTLTCENVLFYSSKDKVWKESNVDSKIGESEVFEYSFDDEYSSRGTALKLVDELNKSEHYIKDSGKKPSNSNTLFEYYVYYWMSECIDSNYNPDSLRLPAY